VKFISLMLVIRYYYAVEVTVVKMSTVFAASFRKLNNVVRHGIISV